jgi:hypothetical protein
MTEESKGQGGRPTKYDPSMNEIVTNYCLMGATDRDLAAFLDVDERTINRWKEEHPEFCQSIKEGKEVADARVALSLYNRAMGVTVTEQKVVTVDGQPETIDIKKEYPPDATSMIFWMKNRQPEKWRDKIEQQVSVEDTTPRGIEAIGDASQRLRKMFRASGWSEELLNKEFPLPNGYEDIE